jgi:hypothetical protein
MAMTLFLQEVNFMIERKRIRNIDNYLIGISQESSFYVCKKIDGIPLNKITSIGLSNPIEVGEQVLPKIMGSISRFNAQGGFLKLKDLPMETCYREIAVKDWHGNYHYVDVPYRRYQRKEILAPGVEVKIVEKDGTLFFASPLLIRNNANNGIIKHVINLFLELFGSCEILDDSFIPALSSIPTKRVNWKILPEGEYPWKRLAKIAGDIESSRSGKAKIQEHCIDAILKYKPVELIYGTGGFRGYLVFKFSAKGIFVMENVMYGNATYIFENDWEQFSQLTKAEIINNRFQKDRIEHRAGWEEKINRLLK